MPGTARKGQNRSNMGQNGRKQPIYIFYKNIDEKSNSTQKNTENSTGAVKNINSYLIFFLKLFQIIF